MAMTISILSPAASAKAVAVQSGTSAAGVVAEGSPFAGLFGLQLSQLAALSPASSGTESDGEGAGNVKKSAKKAPLSDEPVLAGPVMALPTVPPTITPELKQGLQLGKGDASPADEAQQELLTALKGDRHALPGAQNLPVDGAAQGQFLPVHASATGAAHAAAEAGQAKVLALPLPISDSNWAKSMSEQMLSLVSVKADKAQIQINPPELGPIDVTLKLNHDQVQVTFSATTPQAREAVENSLPKLASMLASSGLQLADAQVSSGQSGDPRQFQRQAKAARQQEDAPAEGNDTLSLINKARNVLSIFA
ncbi:flagellar hook-length control protein [Pseudogulbenkiania ferrooxidans 2002]|uniref:Flagellar hook-length control protein n=2 Tax=Pseudogulbenkiania ferrooxidans TaxID=549169 RepID=B9Z796_9NEIS|nr:flagellar hook-length control protein [Pseudogulbenkiania ferrooxidans 2002]